MGCVNVVPIKALVQRNIAIVRDAQTCDQIKACSKKTTLDALMLLDTHYNNKVKKMILVRENKK